MGNQSNSKKSGLSREQRRLRVQRVIFIIVSVILILSWVLTLVINQ
jgi:predicted nucleic acid-binding Zn ribbon protein